MMAWRESRRTISSSFSAGMIVREGCRMAKAVYLLAASMKLA
jgi:hypothetical protein